MVSEKEIEAACEAWQKYWCEKDVPRNTRHGITAALEAAARVRAEDNAGEPVAWPKIMYVCENCLEYNPEMCGHDRRDIYVTPDGRWLCDSCIEGEGTSSRDCTTPPMLYAHPAPQSSGTVEALKRIAQLKEVRRGGGVFDYEPALSAMEMYEIAFDALSALTAGKPEQECAALKTQEDE